jgi:DNA replication protein DnaC
MTLNNESELNIALKMARKEQDDNWHKSCGLQGVQINKTFANFEKQYQPTVHKMLKEYDFGKSLIISSPDIYGVGKTHLVCALINRILENETKADIIGDVVKAVYKYNCPVYFTTEPQLLARIKDTYDNKEKTEREQDVYKQINKVQLLIIDDIGKLRPHDISFTQDVYFRIIDDRYNNEKDIIITTNLGWSDFESHIGGASADRLREMCGKDGLIKMTGKSYRRNDNG